MPAAASPRSHRGAEERPRAGAAGWSVAPLASDASCRPTSAALLPAVVRLLGEACPDDPVERRRRRRQNPRDGLRLVAQDRGDQGRTRGPGKGSRSRRHLVERRPQREDVGAAVRLFSFHLFRRHVGEGSEDRAFLCEIPALPGHRWRVGKFRCMPRRRHRLREAEVEQLDPLLRQHHVGGLQISMNDPLPMRLVQGIRDLDAVAQRLLERQRASRESIGQGLALEVLHDEVLGLAFPSHVIERADVRVRELRDGSRFPLEALTVLRGGALLRQDLDRHGPVQARVPRLVHLAHSAGADCGEDLVRPEARSDGQGHGVLRTLRHAGLARATHARSRTRRTPTIGL